MPQPTVKFYVETLMRAMIPGSRKACELAGTRGPRGALADPTQKRRAPGSLAISSPEPLRSVLELAYGKRMA